jgi:polar amino acid transport system substrate-binding protein
MIKKILVNLIALLLLSCTENITEEEVLIVGTAADNPPYEFIKDNDIVGLDIDIIKLIAERLNKKIIIKNMEFYSLLPSLDNKQIDLIIAGVSATEARKKHFDFSDVYFTSKIVFITLKDSGIQTLEDLNKKTIAVQTGTIFENIANNGLAQKYDVNILSLSNFLIAIEELKKGSVHGVMTEEVQAENLLKYNPELQVTSLAIEESSEYAIIMPKESEYRERVNEIIDELMMEGKINEIKEQWLQ